MAAAASPLRKAMNVIRSGSFGAAGRMGGWVRGLEGGVRRLGRGCPALNGAGLPH